MSMFVQQSFKINALAELTNNSGNVFQTCGTFIRKQYMCVQCYSNSSGTVKY